MRIRTASLLAIALLTGTGSIWADEFNKAKNSKGDPRTIEAMCERDFDGGLIVLEDKTAFVTTVRIADADLAKLGVPRALHTFGYPYSPRRFSPSSYFEQAMDWQRQIEDLLDDK